MRVVRVVLVVCGRCDAAAAVVLLVLRLFLLPLPLPLQLLVLLLMPLLLLLLPPPPPSPSLGGLPWGGTWEVGVGLGGDVGEGAQGVGADKEVVLHKEEVARQAGARPHQRHHRPRLPPHLPPPA